jgi:hypothetical protein
MVTAPVVINKKTSRDFFRIAAGSFEGVVLCSLSSQHVFFIRRRPALLKREVAESKGEVEIGASATHDEAYYRQH